MQNITTSTAYKLKLKPWFRCL